MDASICSAATCHIDLAAIGRNFHRLGPAERLMPVVKSDAYGHGLVPVARVLANAGARRFAVGLVPEGLALRRAGLGQEAVALLGARDEAEWQACAEHGVLPVVGCMEDLDRAAACVAGGRLLRVAVKCETGMGRLGFSQESLPGAIDRLRSLPGVRPVMAVTHLACADMADGVGYTDAQARRFDAMTAALREAFPGMPRSLDNTAGLLGREGAPFDIGRPGIALYGGNPFAGTAWEGKGASLGLEWAMSVSAPVLEVRLLRAGQSLSYGRLFTAARDTAVAVAGIGYASGYARGLSGRLAMLVNGRRAPQIGRVCMGMTMLDVTGLGPVRPGDMAWAVGGPAQDGEQPVTPQDLADALGTISYEILCLMGGMNGRRYRGA